jgi:TfoX-like protein
MRLSRKHDVIVNTERLRAALAGHLSVTEKRMFGGVCFLLRDHMLCASSTRGFMFRVGKAQNAKALARRGVTQVVMRGRRLEGFVRVDPARCNARSLGSWIGMAKDYVGVLPRKERPARGTPSSTAKGRLPGR